MTQIINGQELAQTINLKTKTSVTSLKTSGRALGLAVILIGENEASKLYVEKKAQAAKEIGLLFELHEFASVATESEIIAKIKEINADPKITGLIVQLPIPKNLSTPNILSAISKEKDVDCLTNENLGALVTNTPQFIPPTVGAVMSILESLNFNPAGKNFTIVGTGQLVGKPLTIHLLNLKANVTTANSLTENLADKCSTADVIVSATGKPNLITKDMVKPGAIVIDAGSGFLAGKTVGDVDFANVKEVAGAITPTPGGVGPLTVAWLLKNTVGN